MYGLSSDRGRPEDKKVWEGRACVCRGVTHGVVQEDEQRSEQRSRPLWHELAKSQWPWGGGPSKGTECRRALVESHTAHERTGGWAGRSAVRSRSAYTVWPTDVYE
jgi:hypothetical protein